MFAANPVAVKGRSVLFSVLFLEKMAFLFSAQLSFENPRFWPIFICGQIAMNCRDLMVEVLDAQMRLINGNALPRVDSKSCEIPIIQ